MSNLLLSDQHSLKQFFNEPIFVVADEIKTPNPPTVIQEEIESAAEVPPIVLASGAAHAEVAPTEEVKPAVENVEVQIESNPIQLIGNYKNGILILVQDAAHAVSSEEGKLLLKNIIKFLNIGKDDFGILNLANNPDLNYTQIKTQLNPVKIFSFGVDLKGLLFPVESTELFQTADNITYYIGHELTAMAKSLEMKKQFNAILKNYKN